VSQLTARVAALELELADSRAAAASATAQAALVPFYRSLTAIEVVVRPEDGATSAAAPPAGVYQCATTEPDTGARVAFTLEFVDVVPEAEDGAAAAAGEPVAMVEYVPGEGVAAALPVLLRDVISFEAGQAPMFLSKITESLRHMVPEEEEKAEEEAAAAEPAPEQALQTMAGAALVPTSEAATEAMAGDAPTAAEAEADTEMAPPATGAQAEECRQWRLLPPPVPPAPARRPLPFQRQPSPLHLAARAGLLASRPARPPAARAV
jgi:hypothetical protein